MAKLQANPDQSKTISVDSSGFSKNLSGSDDTIQAVADALDALVASSYPEDSIIIVQHGANDVENGTNLLAAYAKAKTEMSPAIDNPIWIIVPTGRYDIGSSTLNRDTDYIHMVGMGVCRNHNDDPIQPWLGAFSYPSTMITGTATNLIYDTMRYALLKGFLLHQETSTNNHIQINEVNGADGAAYIDIGLTQDGTRGYGIYTSHSLALIASYFEQCHTPTTCIGQMVQGGEFSGAAIDCTHYDYSYGSTYNSYNVECSGVLIRCRGRDRLGGCVNLDANGTFSGYAEDCFVRVRCLGGTGSSGVGTFSGTAIRCTSLLGLGFGYGEWTGAKNHVCSGTVIDCFCATGGFGGFGTITSTAKLIRCSSLEDHAFLAAWGAQGVNGYLEDCDIRGADLSLPDGSGSTASTGTLVNCRIPDMTRVIEEWNGKMVRCTVESTGDGVQVLGNDAEFYDTKIKVGAASDSITAASAQSVKMSGCITNRDLDANVTNSLDSGYNVLDASL